jgi:type I restriction-modification system DNA methylase subunit
MSQKKQYYTINEPDKLLEFINSELKPKEKEKKENGEVFTPLSLVNEMLDKLDDAYMKENGKSIFSENGFKWLDPAAGIGNFSVIVYQRLMKGLNIQLPNEEERRKHILEHMIYSSELTPKNVFIYKKIFCGDKYKLNIYEGDTLKMDMKNEFKLSADFVGFDVVMGNPPYQKKIGDKNTQPLWHLFVIHSLKYCKSNGYLVFVHPSGWRSPKGAFKNVLDLIMSKN